MATPKTDHNTVLKTSEHALKDDRGQEKDGGSSKHHRWKCIRQNKGWLGNVRKSFLCSGEVPRTIGLIDREGLGTQDVTSVRIWGVL